MIFRLIIGIVLFYCIYKLLSGRKADRRPAKMPQSTPGEDLVEDPLCHTYVPVSHAHRLSIDGKTLYFCSQKCLEQFRGKKE